MNPYESQTEFGEFEDGELGEFGEFEEGEAGEFGEAEDEQEQFLGDVLGSVLGGEVGSPLSDAQEMELASELLEISNEPELEQFLGGLFKKVAHAAGSLIKSPVGRALGGILKNVAKKALPVVGGALGSMVAPGVGTAIGSKLGSMAGGLFELELEDMPNEQAEFEVARRYVRLAANAARNAALAQPRRPVHPVTVARAAVAKAARTQARGLYRQVMRSLTPAARAAAVRRRPGLAPANPFRPRPRPGVQPTAPRAPGVYGPGVVRPPETTIQIGIPEDAFEPAPHLYPGMHHSGRWVRRGHKIIVFGV